MSPALSTDIVVAIRRMRKVECRARSAVSVLRAATREAEGPVVTAFDTLAALTPLGKSWTAHGTRHRQSHRIESRLRCARRYCQLVCMLDMLGIKLPQSVVFEFECRIMRGDLPPF
jgi:hypothetical protein